jgi:hypothetical protein
MLSLSPFGAPLMRLPSTTALLLALLQSHVVANGIVTRDQNTFIPRKEYKQRLRNGHAFLGD